MSVTFIGDVHGWRDRLDRVLEQVEGPLVFLGDLIDRGPEAPAVLDRVRDLCARGRATCVMGNHEYALLRGLGVPEAGIPCDRWLWQSWIENYGGDAVLAAYRVSDDDPEALRDALGEHLSWLAGLPWVLSGIIAGRTWVAVHAGLGSGPIDEQLATLADPRPFMRAPPGAEQPKALYSKRRATLVPDDCPTDTCVVSGHTPMPSAVIKRQRILCDTSGGREDRRLSAVVWPEGRVVTS